MFLKIYSDFSTSRQKLPKKLRKKMVDFSSFMFLKSSSETEEILTLLRVSFPQESTEDALKVCTVQTSSLNRSPI